MKQNDLTDTKYKLSPQQYENIFNVYEDIDIGYFYNILKTVNFPEDLNPGVYDLYEVQPGDTWPYISWKVYNSILLWWCICSTNNISNPIEPLTPGTQLKILKSAYLKNVLNTIQSD